MLDNFMWAISTPFVGFLVLCFILGFINRLFKFEVKIEGLFFILSCVTIGWVFLKLVGAY